MTTMAGTTQIVSEEDGQYVGTGEPADKGVYFNTTDSTAHFNHTRAAPLSADSGFGLSTAVTVSVIIGSAVIFIIIVIVVILFIRKRRKKKSKPWVDNLTLSYIADSNIDLTKDNFDETISLDNDNFLNSLDQNNFSVWTPEGSARQYTYSYF